MENKSPARVPRFIWLVIVVMLASMYGYYLYFDPSPDRTVEKFYQAYFDEDYETVARNSSVFWAVNFLPQYAAMTAPELLDNRAKIEKDVVKVITEMQKSNPVPEGVKIKLLRDYTKQGTYSAVVVYEIIESGNNSSTEAAILIKEKSGFKIFAMTPLDPQNLDQVKALDITEMDENFKQLLVPAEEKTE